MPCSGWWQKIQGGIIRFTGSAVESNYNFYSPANFRIKMLKQSGFGDTPMKCMEFPEESDLTKQYHVSATLAAARPGCLSDGNVDFSK